MAYYLNGKHPIFIVNLIKILGKSLYHTYNFQYGYTTIYLGSKLCVYFNDIGLHFLYWYIIILTTIDYDSIFHEKHTKY